MDSAAHPWWRTHLSLIVGVSLPILLVLLFWIAMLIPRVSVEDPAYDLILASRNVPDALWFDGRLGFEVREGQLLAVFSRHPTARAPENRGVDFSTPAPRLYYFSTGGESLRELAYTLPADLDDEARIPLDVVEGRTLIGESVAPDGYRFDTGYRGTRGFLFLFDRYGNDARIEKDGRTIRIPGIDGRVYTGDYEFVAWVERGRE